MTITALPTHPARSMSSDAFVTAADAFLGALPTFATQANALAVAMNFNSTTDTSTSSVLIGTGAKTFTVTAGKSFQGGMWLVIADTAAPSTNSMMGQVTSYSGTTLVMNITSVIGSGTKTAWTISQSSASSFDSEATTVAICSAATTLTIGATTGTATIQNPTVNLGGTSALPALKVVSGGGNTNWVTITGSATNPTIGVSGGNLNIISPTDTTSTTLSVSAATADAHAVNRLYFKSTNRYLGCTQVTSSLGSFYGNIDLAGYSVTVTVLAGQSIQITGFIPQAIGTVATDRMTLQIKEGATQLAGTYSSVNTGFGLPISVVLVITAPSAGSHTYKLSGGIDIGTGNITLNAGTIFPGFISVEVL